MLSHLLTCCVLSFLLLPLGNTVATPLTHHSQGDKTGQLLTEEAVDSGGDGVTGLPPHPANAAEGLSGQKGGVAQDGEGVVPGVEVEGWGQVMEQTALGGE